MKELNRQIDRRVQKLEATIEETFTLANISEKPIEIMTRYMLDHAQSEDGGVANMTPYEALDLYMHTHGLDKAARIQVIRMLGELHTAGDDKTLEEHLERLRALKTEENLGS